MLILNRRREESIHISDNIVVTVLDIRGSKVRLGVTAPRDIAVQRAELQNHIADSLQHGFRTVANLEDSEISPGVQSWETEGGANK